jgi:hypothetical protein
MPSVEELDEIVKSLNFTVQVEEGSPPRTFGDFTTLKTFFDKQLEFWQQCGNSYAVSAFSQVVSPLAAAIGAQNAPSARGHMSNAANRIKSGGASLIYSGTPRAEFLQRLTRKNQEMGLGAFLYFAPGYQNGNYATNNSSMSGFIAASLFSNPEFFDSSVSTQVDSFSAQRSEIAMFRDGIAAQAGEFELQSQGLLSGFQEQSSKLLGETSEVAIRERKVIQERFEESYEDWKKQVHALQSAYDEQLRLKAPAKYWADLETRHDQNGRIWTWISASVVAALLILCVVFVYQPPAILNSKDFTLGGFKGAIVITVGLSMVIYLINMLARFAMSAFHLARDAQERHQLTLVFLALIKEQAIEPADRAVILASLFARAETGLLKYDSSPTTTTPMSAIADMMKPKS